MSLVEEVAELRAGRAAARAPLELLELAGPDRERILHGLTTGEVRKLAPGTAVEGFFTSAQGRILADYRLLAREDRFWLLLPSGTAAPVAAHLEKYRLASNVDVRPHPGLPILSGYRSIPESFVGDGEAVATLDPAARAKRFLLLPAAPEQAREPEAWMRTTTEKLCLRRVREEALELARIEDGDLHFGFDFGGDNFPQETGREAAVNYSKGCFLGQEVVARIHYRGGVQKRPCGLRFAAEAPPAAGVELTLDGRAVGRATSVAVSPRHGAIGLGILHQRGAEIGTLLAWEGGPAEGATVVSLPFEISG
jgi:folate-binding protein YgfZ